MGESGINIVEQFGAAKMREACYDSGPIMIVLKLIWNRQNVKSDFCQIYYFEILSMTLMICTHLKSLHNAGHVITSFSLSIQRCLQHGMLNALSLSQRGAEAC